MMIEQETVQGHRAKAGSQDSRRVLVVDDDPDILAILEILLSQEGYQVFPARDGREFLALLRQISPQVALLDYRLPDLSGMELVRLARRIDEEVPLICITGQGNERLVVELMKAGASNYLAKPFENDEVLAAVRQGFEERRVRASKAYRDLASLHRALLASMHEKEAILRSLTDGLILADRDLRVLSWNRAAETLTGWREEAVVGRLLPEVFAEEFCAPERALLAGSGADAAAPTECLLRRAEGGKPEAAVLKSASLLRGEGGEATGVVIALKDITALRQMHQERVDRERELARVQEELRYRDVLAQKNLLLERQMTELNRRMSETTTLYEVTKLLSSKLDLSDVLSTVMNLAGKIFQAQASSIRLLEPQGRRLELVAHQGLGEEYCRRPPIPLGVSVAGLAAERGEAVHVEDVQSDPRFSHAEAARREGLRSLLCLPLMLRERCIGVMSFYHRHAHAYTPDEIQFLATFAGTVSIAIENARLYQEQSRQAVTDGLTGLYNHKHFHEHLALEVLRSRRYGTSLSLVLVDIDHFKCYNDAYGHQAGDALLRELAGLLRKAARENDFAARYGGEEFALLLPQTNKREALTLARRLCRKVERHRCEGEEVLPGGRLTISIGVAAYPEDVQLAQDLIHRADQALYLAKNQGRNQVQAYQQVH